MAHRTHLAHTHDTQERLTTSTSRTWLIEDRQQRDNECQQNFARQRQTAARQTTPACLLYHAGCTGLQQSIDQGYVAAFAGKAVGKAVAKSTSAVVDSAKDTASEAKDVAKDVGEQSIHHPVHAPSLSQQTSDLRLLAMCFWYLVLSPTMSVAAKVLSTSLVRTCVRFCVQQSRLYDESVCFQSWRLVAHHYLFQFDA